MADHWLRKKNGEPIAIIRTQSEGVQRLFKPNGTFLGEYRPYSDTTHIPNGDMVGRGNLLATLV